MKRLLHVGCGTLRLENLPAYFNDGNWREIRFDIDPATEPDVVGDSQDLSVFEDGSLDAIYSAHNIEHVWAFEVPRVLAEFRRVVAPDGFLVLQCPDILAVAQAVVEGRLEESLYESPVGPITGIDILYGYQQDIMGGRHYMAHKMAFTPDTLASHVLRAGFASVALLRDRGFGLTALASPRPVSHAWAQETIGLVCSQPGLVTEGRAYGEFLA